jgi:hypothetical protein
MIRLQLVHLGASFKIPASPAPLDFHVRCSEKIKPRSRNMHRGIVNCWFTAIIQTVRQFRTPAFKSGKFSSSSATQLTEDAQLVYMPESMTSGMFKSIRG